jgi:predicted DNA-binding protein (MmcQ/YjbR family)
MRKLLKRKNGEGYVDVVNVKCAQEIIDSMWQESGIFPAYHMNKNHWLTLALDGSADDDTVIWLVGMSYELTLHKKKKK